MGELATVFRALFVRNLLMMRRYLFNSLSGLVTMYIVFMLLMTGARAIGGETFAAGGASLEGLAVGYLVWGLSMMGYQELAYGINNEAQMGTLEKLYLAPVGFRWVSILMQVAMLFTNLALMGILLVAITATTGVSLRVDIISVLPLALITVSAAYGLGFLVGGLALIYKRVQAVFQIIQFGLIGFLALPPPWGRFFPLNLGNRLLVQVMADGARLWELPASDLVTLIMVNVAYLGVGLLAFRSLEGQARQRGLLGHY